METATTTRRRFLKGASSALAATAFAPAATDAAAAAPRPAGPPPRGAIRLGGPVFGAGDDPARIARAHRDLGYRAAYCPAASLKDRERVRAIRAAFEKEGVAIAEVGRWVNLLDRVPARRAANLEKVTEGLALAEEVGALCCVDIAGSYNRDVWYGPHPENLSKRFFDEAVENARKIIDAVKPRRAKFCYEVMGWAIPDGPASYRELIRAVDREAFGVHLDPCNAVNSPRRFYQNARLIDEFFDQLGRWIVSCHAKDLQWKVEMNLHFLEVRPGAGSIDYERYLRRLATLSHRPPLMLEHLPNEKEYDAARRYLLELARKLEIETS